MGAKQGTLFAARGIHDELARFDEHGKSTTIGETRCEVGGSPGAAVVPTVVAVPTFVNEFWTSKQRAASSLHEVSYRACFKPQLPRFFIERLSERGERVYDPFMGRGTTLLEAALLGREPIGCDVNPLSAILLAPRLAPPSVAEVTARLRSIDLARAIDLDRAMSDRAIAPTRLDVKLEDLLVFFHRDTLREIVALRDHLAAREAAGALDRVDAWIRMVAVNRLTGHSSGFFSVYTLPPNQAVSVESQRKINRDRDQVPPPRDVASLIVKKTRSLLEDCDATARRALARFGARARLMTARADETREIESGSVALVVTSPPFLDVVDYAGDNWLRCWFSGIDPRSVEITIARRLDDWRAAMTSVFRELRRVLAPRGHIAFEVGEVRGGRVRLEETVIPCALDAELEPVLVLVNAQRFTKTANCWGVANGTKGTNTNRVVLLRRPA